MDLFDSFLQWVNLNWRAIITLLSFVITAYFTFQKIGNKVSITYQTGASRYSDEQIIKIVISNKKDKTISIWSIDAIIENDIKFSVYAPNAPLILKSGESISIAPKQYSNLSLNGEQFAPNFLFGKIDFYANIGNEIIRCIPDRITSNHNTTYRVATKSSISIEGHLYNESVRFILIYYYENKKKIAFIEDCGFIGNEWGMTPNFIEPGYTAIDIQAMLENYGYNNMFTNYVCFENCGATKRFKLAFKKPYTP